MPSFYTIGISIFITTLTFFTPRKSWSQSAKPNIIFILTDDQRWDALGVAGNKIIQTPEIDELAKSGIYFKNAFATTPICAASRASILTGLHERTHGYTFQKPVLKKPYAEIIYPKLFKNNGYHVGFFGKLGVTIDSAEQYFDTSDFYDRGGSPNRKGYFYKTIGKDTVHLTRYTGQQALDFIQQAPTNKPFCLSLSFSAPHGHDNSTEQYYWQEKNNALYAQTTLPEPLLAGDEFFYKLPKEVREGFNRVRWKWRFDTPEKYQQMTKGYYRMITEIDQEIGSIRKLLSQKGIEKNTIIVVMSDNGYFLGDRQLADKWLLYEPSIRIPLLIFDPRNSVAKTCEEMVLNIDVPKTILNLAGIASPPSYQGKSLVPLMSTKNTHINRSSILIEHLWPITEIPSSEGVRTKRWKYFRYRFIDAPEELYDLKKDPLEIQNLAGQIKYQKRLARLKSKLESDTAKYIASKLCTDDPFMSTKNF